jgi:ketosteroid isomerase-like protein
MSRENVETLRQGFAAMSTGVIEDILAFVHPDFEVDIPPELSAEPDTYRGHEGVRRYFQSFADAMDEIRFAPERLWDCGEKVVVALRVTAKGKETGIAVEQHLAQVWTIRDGKALRAQTYPTQAEALEAAGLREEARRASPAVSPDPSRPASTR